VVDACYLQKMQRISSHKPRGYGRNQYDPILLNCIGMLKVLTFMGHESSPDSNLPQHNKTIHTEEKGAQSLERACIGR